jgi:hypothetical protein
MTMVISAKGLSEYLKGEISVPSNPPTHPPMHVMTAAKAEAQQKAVVKLNEYWMKENEICTMIASVEVVSLFLVNLLIHLIYLCYIVLTACKHRYLQFASGIILYRDFPYSLRYLQFASGYEPGSHHNVQQPANQDL